MQGKKTVTWEGRLPSGGRSCSKSASGGSEPKGGYSAHIVEGGKEKGEEDVESLLFCVKKKRESVVSTKRERRASGERKARRRSICVSTEEGGKKRGVYPRSPSLNLTIAFCMPGGGKKKQAVRNRNFLRSGEKRKLLCAIPRKSRLILAKGWVGGVKKKRGEHDFGHAYRKKGEERSSLAKTSRKKHRRDL